MNIEELKASLNTKQKIVIFSHKNPDGDAVGSALAMQGILNKLGHETSIVTPDPSQHTMTFLKGYENIIFNSINPELASEKIADADILWFVDLNDIKTRTGNVYSAIEKNTTAKIVLIDHHVSTPSKNIDFSYTDSKASSTGLLIYRFITEMGLCELIDTDIAYAIYIGMMTDTGNFSYGFLTKEVFNTVAKLLDYGVSPQLANDAIYNRNSESRMRLWGYAMSDKMVVLPEINTAYISLTADELHRFQYKDGDTEGLANIPLTIDGIHNSALLSEKEGAVRISLRSIAGDGADMNALASELYGGGGHKNASGARCKDSMDICIQKFVNGMRQLKEGSNN